LLAAADCQRVTCAVALPEWLRLFTGAIDAGCVVMSGLQALLPLPQNTHLELSRLAAVGVSRARLSSWGGNLIAKLCSFIFEQTSLA